MNAHDLAKLIFGHKELSGYHIEYGRDLDIWHYNTESTIVYIVQDDLWDHWNKTTSKFVKKYMSHYIFRVFDGMVVTDKSRHAPSKN